jgi:hypothetical protein
MHEDAAQAHAARIQWCTVLCALPAQREERARDVEPRGCLMRCVQCVPRRVCDGVKRALGVCLWHTHA